MVVAVQALRVRVPGRRIPRGTIAAPNLDQAYLRRAWGTPKSGLPNLGRGKPMARKREMLFAGLSPLRSSVLRLSGARLKREAWRGVGAALTRRTRTRMRLWPLRPVGRYKTVSWSMVRDAVATCSPSRQVKKYFRSGSGLAQGKARPKVRTGCAGRSNKQGHGDTGLFAGCSRHRCKGRNRSTVDQWAAARRRQRAQGEIAARTRASKT